MTLVGGLTAQVFFNAIERLNMSQAFLRDRGCAGLGDIMQFTVGVRPAIRQCHILSRPLEQAVIASIAIDLQDAAEAAQDVSRVLAGSSWRISEGNAGRILTAPWPVITGKGIPPHF